MTSIRQNKVAKLIQKELGIIFQQELRNIISNAIVSPTTVRMSPDLSVAKVFISIFATGDDKDKILSIIKANSKEIRFILGKRIKNQLRAVPELIFYLDDSLDYAFEIDSLLK